MKPSTVTKIAVVGIVIFIAYLVIGMAVPQVQNAIDDQSSPMFDPEQAWNDYNMPIGIITIFAIGLFIVMNFFRCSEVI
jgi:hypothetical protein